MLQKEAMVNDTSVTHQEGVLRRVNEALERGLGPGEDAGSARMRCECGRFDCNAFVTMRVADYEQMRSNPRLFVLCDGHQTDEIEKIVSRHSGYLIVEKTGSAGRAADRSDPRSGSPDQEPK